MLISNIINEINKILQPEKFHDYCPNGLQVAGKTEIKKIITGVSISEDLIDIAIEKKADLVLVHHGMLWNKDDLAITDIKKNRLKKLLSHDINLIAYHLPLDCNCMFGNNIELAKILNITVNAKFTQNFNTELLFYGHFADTIDGTDFAKLLTEVLARKPFYTQGKQEPIKTIAWCSGGGQDFFAAAHKLNVDAFLTGEVSERNVLFARETGMHFYAAGHHATERYGVKALGNYLEKHFNIIHEFIDIDNPV